MYITNIILPYKTINVPCTQGYFLPRKDLIDAGNFCFMRGNAIWPHPEHLICAPAIEYSCISHLTSMHPFLWLSFMPHYRKNTPGLDHDLLIKDRCPVFGMAGVKAHFYLRFSGFLQCQRR
jgi:hypothetical protein